MKRKINKTVLLCISFLLFSAIAVSQEKYAVIITSSTPTTTGSWADANPERGSWEEFWTDTYIMWETLLRKGYDQDNIFVCYGEGEDYSSIGLHYRYTPAHNNKLEVTDYPAYKTSIDTVFTGLSTGSEVFPQLTQDDFLYVFTFGHGYSTTAIPEDPGVEHTLLGLMGYDKTLDYDSLHSISDLELEEYLDNINAVKKVIVMQQRLSGGFIPEIEGNNIVVLTAANDSMGAKSADTLYYDSIDYPGDTSPGNRYNVPDEMENYEGYETIRYPHGEFDLHFLNAVRGVYVDDISTNYYVPGYQNFPLGQADLNNDYIVSLYETYEWVIDHDSRMKFWPWGHDDPQLSHTNNLAEYTSLEYPTLIFEDIGPLGGMSVEHRGIVGITKDVHITPTNQLTFFDNADVYLLNDADLTVDMGATLVLGDDVSIISRGQDNSLIVNGEIIVGDNLLLKSETENPLEVIINDYFPNNLSLSYPSIETVILTSKSPSLSVYNGSITNSFITQNDGDFLLAFSSLNTSSIQGVNSDITNENSFNMSLNSLSSGYPNSNAIIEIDGYKDYYLSKNSIKNIISTTNPYYGILVSNSGSDRLHYHKIEENNINSGNVNSTGIAVYSSYAEILNNIVVQNQVGIQILNNSITELTGNEEANNESETQVIKNNDLYQVFVSSSTFPTDFHWNAIYEDTYSTYFVYRNIEPGVVYPRADVRYNYWGNAINVEDFLYPADHYGFDPVWSFGGGSPITQTLAELLYTTATNQVSDSAFLPAKNTFKQVTTTYPESDFASTSMRELLYLEPLVGNDFQSLKNWYLTNTVILQNETLTKLGDNLANKCDEKMENYTDAIAWYESVILNPDTPEDSIFAIIDLEHLYLQMGIDTTLRSNVTYGSLTEFIPESSQEHFDHRDRILNLLLGDSKVSKNIVNANNSESKLGQLTNSFPNPFSSSTLVSFDIFKNNPSTIELKVINQTGKTIKSFTADNQSRNLGRFEVGLDGFPSGVYYCVLLVDGNKVDAIKLILSD